MVPLITMTALSPAGHFPLRYKDFIRLSAAGTDARGCAGSAPVLESVPPAETYQTVFWGFAAVSSSGPGNRSPLHPVTKDNERTAAIKIRTVTPASPLVEVTNGSLSMNRGVELRNNSTSGDGGGVSVSNSARFTMNGGTISGNTAGNSGGGVYVSASGSNSAADFTINGGTINGNTATYDGGGVSVYSNASGTSTFTMTGGTISGNKAGASNGGGVYVWASGSGSNADFTMNGGTISGNTASNGGGVGVSNAATGTATFTKADNGNSGTIYGDTDTTHTPGSEENTAFGGNGHAVYVESGLKRRDWTAGPGVHLDSTTTDNWD
jgi:hypothetical protein